MNLQEFLAMEDGCDRDELIDLRGLDFVSDYDSHLMCPICHCPFVDPVRLQCDHVFCQSCLSSAINTFRSADSDEFPCPSCRTPTREVSTSVPRLLINMCDEIRVRCPLITEGCHEIVPRGHVQSHVEKYCGYRLVPCPDDSCDGLIRNKDIGLDGKCIHVLRQCPRCEEDVMEQDYEEHDKKLCPVLETSCVDCETVVARKSFNEHVEACPEVIVPCAAAKYACPVKVRRADIGMHEQSCPLITMIPYFEVQNTRLNSLELSMRHLQQRNEIFEDGLANIRSTLVESARIGASAASSGQSATAGREQTSAHAETNRDDPTDISSSVFSSNATTYLLSLHESLREEVEQIKHNLTDLDARASMALMNECIRMKEDMAHTNAAVNSVRMQVQWLMNPRLHGTRTGAVRANTGGETPRSPMASSSTAGSSSITAQPLGPIRPRRPSDSGREGTKL
ncbi:Zinc finger RING-type [Penicillium nucicola]|uniref:Zinc finger RING-type n=1 Tax=Penicillium nucicola TaxID=1850975 RepID=UPI002544F11B|nr:Zinc finger RING-type [Penicillium nucicola]KAJ5770405.1 Zinc finger RING-type [Penicillium nucicola]